MDNKGTMLKKITVRDVMGNKAGLLPVVASMVAEGVNGKDPAPVVLCKILGLASKAKPGISRQTEKEFVRFVGEFVAINALTGQRFASGAAILPGAAENLIYGALGQMNDSGVAERVVEFGIEVAVKFDKTSATSYVFDIRSLVEPKASVPLQALLEKAGAETPALAAPKAPE